MLSYCFESDKIRRTLEKCRKNDLAVIDVEGCEEAVKSYMVGKRKNKFKGREV